MELEQFDIKTAFLNGSLEENVYMEQPPGYEDGTNRVCHLRRSLYGLKQASRNWNSIFSQFLMEHDLTIRQSDSDTCVFIRDENSEKWMIICLYVDDGLIACKDKELLENFLSSLRQRFEITSHKPSCYVGLEIKRNRESKEIYINQQGYISRMLRRFGMEDCKALTSPMECTRELYEEPVLDDKKRFPYREAIGSLNYIALISRPDISYAVNVLARFSNSPSEVHWNAVKRIMRYLKGTIAMSICYCEDTDDRLIGFCDSDHAGDLKERRSTSGYIFMLHNGPISWSSSLQDVSALSSTEADKGH